ncbi:hypothetical protein [Methylobacillus rhizosphaerae]|uniref:hypothetical protein n=1 Tax=Methylobacillus rhizosphaerae TaxID=551994 RepID=UPI0015C58869|nr:hypothetical protein [Methylobacillus rhizosphaerae]
MLQDMLTAGMLLINQQRMGRKAQLIHFNMAQDAAQEAASQLPLSLIQHKTQ